MQNQRNFLLALFVGLLVWIGLQWQNEQTAKYTASIASVEPTNNLAAGSVPASVGSSSAAVNVPTAIGQTTSNEARITVKTDVLEAVISTKGGDIVYVGLPTYPLSLEKTDQPFILLSDQNNKFFVAQNGLLSSDNVAPNHQATFLTEQTSYQLEQGQDSLVVPLTWQDEQGHFVTKTYLFKRNSFEVELTQQVKNQTDKAWPVAPYMQLQQLQPVSKSSLFGGVSSYIGGVFSAPVQEKVYEKVSFDRMKKVELNQEVQGGWIAMIEHYFLASWIPDQAQSKTFYTKALEGNRFVIGIKAAFTEVPSNGEESFASRLYVGPKIQKNLAEVAPHLDLTVDYGWLTFIAQLLFALMGWIHGLVGNWGWSIILLTIFVKLVLYIPSEMGYRSMARMKKLGPEMQLMKERFGDDRQKMSAAMMELYRKEKVNPLGGCLPILLQMPIFIALYWMLNESVELRQAPWAMWIHDLSLRDPFFILPLLMGATMFIQQKLNPPPPDPMQAKIMQWMPVMFTFMFLWFPSGLVLYWVVSNTWSIAQQWVINKRIGAN